MSSPFGAATRIWHSLARLAWKCTSSRPAPTRTVREMRAFITPERNESPRDAVAPFACGEP